MYNVVILFPGYIEDTRHDTTVPTGTSWVCTNIPATTVLWYPTRQRPVEQIRIPGTVSTCATTREETPSREMAERRKGKFRLTKTSTVQLH